MRTSTGGDRAVVRVTGYVDVTTAASLRNELAGLIQADTSDIVVDLTQVTFLDSTGIGVLVGALKRIRETGGRMELALDDARVLRILRVAGLNQAFTIHPSVADALAADA